MHFFFSGELDVQVADAWQAVARSLEHRLNEALESRDYGPALREIALIPMILRPEWFRASVSRMSLLIGLSRRRAVASPRATSNHPILPAAADCAVWGKPHGCDGFASVNPNARDAPYHRINDPVGAGRHRPPRPLRYSDTRALDRAPF